MTAAQTALIERTRARYERQAIQAAESPARRKKRDRDAIAYRAAKS